MRGWVIEQTHETVPVHPGGAIQLERRYVVGPRDGSAGFSDGPEPCRTTDAARIVE